MRTANLAVMFTDLVDYTRRTSEQSYEQNADMLQRFSAVVTEISRNFGGRVVKQMGDGALLVFHSPTRAVQAAMAIQDRVAENNRPRTESDHLRLRIGINVGEVRLQRGDVFGDAVNVAARIEAETPVGGIYISGTTYMTMNRSGLEFDAVGVRRLKGVDEEVPLFSVAGCVHDADEKSARKDSRNEDEELPFRGQTLRRLRATRRRVRRKAIAVSAALACLLAVGVQYGFRVMSEYREEQRALSLVAEGRLLQVVDAMGHGGIASTEPVVDAVLSAVSRSTNPANVCAILEQLESMGAGSELRRSQLRTRAAGRLAIIGELAQARGCLPSGLDPASEEGREVALVNIHLDATDALNQHQPKALREQLLRYEEFLRGGTADRAHLDLIAEFAAQGYLHRTSRPVADSLVVEFLNDGAIHALANLARDPETSTVARNWVVARLEDIGTDANVDWLAIYGAQLEGGMCAARKSAISGLRQLGLLTAVGLLQREAARRDRCTFQSAMDAVVHLVERGQMPSPDGPELLATR